MFFQAVSLKIATIKSQHAMAEAMKGVTKAMGRMNKNMKLPQIQKIMQGKRTIHTINVLRSTF